MHITRLNPCRVFHCGRDNWVKISHVMSIDVEKGDTVEDITKAIDKAIKVKFGQVNPNLKSSISESKRFVRLENLYGQQFPAHKSGSFSSFIDIQ